jgi:hypothetical protein
LDDVVPIDSNFTSLGKMFIFDGVMDSK